jgi:hypothetical protein
MNLIKATVNSNAQRIGSEMVGVTQSVTPRRIDGIQEIAKKNVAKQK